MNCFSCSPPLCWRGLLQVGLRVSCLHTMLPRAACPGARYTIVLGCHKGGPGGPALKDTCLVPVIPFSLPLFPSLSTVNYIMTGYIACKCHEMLHSQTHTQHTQHSTAHQTNANIFCVCVCVSGRGGVGKSPEGV